MIPLQDVSRRPSHFPVVTLSIIAVNVLVFVLELNGGEPFVRRWALTSVHITAGRDWITLLTAMFMHGGWLHLLGNMIFFWVFGPVIEDVMGRRRYLAFYLLGGLAAAAAQIAVAPTSTAPTLGASGAIAAVMGAFLFTYPRDKIRTVVLLGILVVAPLISAMALVGLWFLIQVISAVGVLATTHAQQGGVAYMAHVGGFLFGLVAARYFEASRDTAEENAPDTDRELP